MYGHDLSFGCYVCIYFELTMLLLQTKLTSNSTPLREKKKRERKKETQKNLRHTQKSSKDFE